MNNLMAISYFIFYLSEIIMILLYKTPIANYSFYVNFISAIVLILSIFLYEKNNLKTKKVFIFSFLYFLTNLFSKLILMSIKNFLITNAEVSKVSTLILITVFSLYFYTKFLKLLNEKFSIKYFKTSAFLYKVFIVAYLTLLLLIYNDVIMDYKVLYNISIYLYFLSGFFLLMGLIKMPSNDISKNKLNENMKNKLKNDIEENMDKATNNSKSNFDNREKRRFFMKKVLKIVILMLIIYIIYIFTFPNIIGKYKGLIIKSQIGPFVEGEFKYGNYIFLVKGNIIFSNLKLDNNDLSKIKIYIIGKYQYFSKELKYSVYINGLKIQ